MSRRFDDDQIDKFLKKNQPLAPGIDERKVHATLLARLGFVSEGPRRRVAPWFAFSGAMAAGLVAVFVMSSPELLQNRDLATPVAAILDAEWDDDIYEEELPAMEVGEDYLELMARNDSMGRVSK